MQRTRVVLEDTVDRFMSVHNYKIRANIPGVTGRTEVDVDNDTYWHIAVDDLGYGSASRLYNQLSSLGCVVALFFGGTLIAETATSVPEAVR